MIAHRIPWQVVVSEFIGTALLLLVGLSLVIFIFGAGSPVARLVPDEGVRRLISGFLFGGLGGSIALSPIGRESGAHINPVVTMGFWLLRKITGWVAVGYIVAQLLGAVAGSLPLLLWGDMGKSVFYGATIPGHGYSTETVVLGEIVTTFLMVTGLCVFLGFRHLRPFTPALFPFLYSIMVFIEAPISGTSTNPARSFGPAVISGIWEGWWVFLVGPLIGGLLAIIACSFLARRIEVAKLYYFESDRRMIFRSGHPRDAAPA
jgi:aquaporin Z